MGDSDDEYDRKRRDKFRGERSDSYRTERRDERRPMGGPGSARDEWAERNPFRGGAAAPGGGGGSARHRPDYSDYRGPAPRQRFGSPGRDMPPAKRMRPDWGDGDMRGHSRFGSYDSYLMAWNEHYHSMHSAYSHAQHMPHAREPPGLPNDTLTQPAMLTLKQFLDTQEEGISDSEVMRKYTAYKTDFKRQQLNEFFIAHKDEEWFKNKYHPEDSVRRSEEQRGFLKRRSDVFVELLNSGTIDSVKVDSYQGDALMRVLDICVIKLEGGTDDDLKVLDEKPKELLAYERKPAESVESSSKRNEPTEESPKSPKKDKNEDDGLPVVVSPKLAKIKSQSDEENWDDDDDQNKSDIPSAGKSKVDGGKDSGSESNLQLKKKKKSKKRKRKSSDHSSSSSSDSEFSSSSEDDEDDEEVKQKYDVEGLKLEKVTESPSKADADEPKAPASPTDQTKEDGADNPKIESPKGSEKPKPADDDPKDTETTVDDADVENGDKEIKPDTDATAKSEDATEAETETIDLDKVKDGPVPRALHRTSSIFLRNLAPAITKAEIEGLCKRFGGYLRVAIADPLVERRWYRRGWITFSRDVNIKEICWSLNNQRLRDCEIGAIVNRDLSRRVRPTNGITAHKQIVRTDIKLCAKIVMSMDERFKLWTESAEEKASADDTMNEATANGSGSGSTTYGFNSKNPVLQNITDYLIEEASAEEDELLGLAGENKDGEGEPLERDDQLISVLDRLVLYLRIVHSVDYYNHCEYPYEDEMPNRCGIIHARGPAPMRVTNNDLQEYIKNFEIKLQPFLTKVEPLSDDDVKELGAKDAETEVEKFVQANTQELAKDKWLCPLSGKKFKGPEFIRKHIFNKHEEKVDEVRKEVQFFNNYLRDPKRPQLPEHPGATKRPDPETMRGPGGGFRPAIYPPFPAIPYGFPAPMMGGGGRGGRGYPSVRRPGGFDYRPRSHYRDLDAPQEPY